MSTRAQILVEGQPCKIYKHSDGYPEGVLPFLAPYVATFMKHRGFDDCYMTARILMAWGIEEAKEIKEMLKGMDKGDGVGKYYEKPQVLGFGVDNDWHGDIEFCYIIRKDGSIDVYSVLYGKSKDKDSLFLSEFGDEVSDIKRAKALCGTKKIKVKKIEKIYPNADIENDK
jgi:hypothetical protein